MAQQLEWKKWTIADSGTVKDIAEQAKTLAEAVKTTSTFASTAMGLVKVISELQNANIFLAALDKVADELIKSIHDMKEAGYYYLYVDPYWKKNVDAIVEDVYGFEVLRDDSGRRLFWNPSAADPEGTTTTSVPPFASATYVPKLVMPRKLFAGGENPYKASMVDPFALMSPFPKYSAQKVLQTMSEAFKDPGDVPRYEWIPGGPTDGTIVFDDDGQPYTGWITGKEFPLQLWNMGERTGDGSPHKDKFLLEGGWRSERVEINRRSSSGKPNIKGNTEFGAGSSAIVLLIAAPSYQIFVDSFNAFSKLFSDIPDLYDSTMKSLKDTYEEFLAPPEQVITLTMCDTNYGLFKKGDIIRGQNYGGLGKITEVANTANSSIVSTQLYTITDDSGQTRQTYAEKDMNENGRFKDMTVTLEPIPTKESKGIEFFTPNDGVREQEMKGYWGTAPENYPNYMVKGAETRHMTGAKTSVKEGALDPDASSVSGRVYPKYGTVAMQALKEPPEATPPNFYGIQASQIIPMWKEFFELLENFVISVKGYVATSTAFIDDMIETINGLIEFLEDMIKTITEFLKFFEVDLSGAGIYALHVKDQQEGNDGLASAITSAKGLPNNLDYAAGILFVGVEVLGLNLLDELLAPILASN